MEKNSKQGLAIDFLIIFLVSLIPFLWTIGGYVILGHDAGTPISPQFHFLDRLYTWTHRYGLGANQTFAIPGFFIHGLEYLLDKIGLSLSMGQAVSFSLYFMGMGYSMYYLARRLFPSAQYLPLFAAIFYQVNHFVLQAWFVAERTKFTTYIALPLVIALVYDVYRKKVPPFKAGVLTALILFILNGGGFLPLFGSFLLIIPLLVFLLVALSPEKFHHLKNFAVYVIASIVSSITLQSYWIIPYIQYLRSSFTSEIERSGDIEGILNWASSISSDASLLNILRLQGIQEWYVNPHHPYAHYFLQNHLLIAVSYLLPIFAFGSIFIADKKYKPTLIILSLLALVSMFFMSGVHPPFGWIYVLLLKYIPGFIAFRTPYYKFAPALWLSYSLLIGYSVDFLYKKYLHIVPSAIKKVFIVVLIISYSFPILGTKFFQYHPERTTRIKIPSYVEEYGHLANDSSFPFRRILVLPPTNPAFDFYATETTWGYWSLATLNSLIDTNSYVEKTSTNTKGENILIDDLYRSIIRNEPDWVNKAKFLNIDGVLLREDIIPYTMLGEKITSDFFKRVIEKKSELKKYRSLGKWHIYQLGSRSSPVEIKEGYYNFQSYETDDKITATNLPIALDSGSVFTTSKNPIYSPLLIANLIIPKCEHCLLLNSQVLKSTDTKILPGSKLFNFKLLMENRNRNKSSDTKVGLIFETRMLENRTAEMIRLYEKTKDSPDAYIAGWNNYLAQIKRVQELLVKYDGEVPFGSDKNTQLLTVYDIIELQQDEFYKLIDNINNPQEAEAFQSVIDTGEDIKQFIKTRSFFTTDILTKSYLVPINKAQAYDLFVRRDTLNLEDDEDRLTYEIDGKPYTTSLDSQAEWIKLTNTKLSAAHHKIKLIENKVYVTLDTARIQEDSNISREENGTITLNYRNLANQKCISLNLGRLEDRRYKLELDLKSVSDPATVTGFVFSNSITHPLLPRWGKIYEVSPNFFEKLTADITPKFAENYRYMICQLHSSTPQNLTLNNLTVTLISSPRLVLVAQNPSHKPGSQKDLIVNRENNTSYNLDLPSGEAKLISFDQRYDTYWNINDKDIQENHLLLNGYANGWIAPTNTNKKSLKLQFTPQKSYKYGSVLTAISLIVICVYLFYDRYYNIKKKN